MSAGTLSQRERLTDSGPETFIHDLSLDLYAVFLSAHKGSTEDLVHAIADGGQSMTKLKLLHILARPHTRPPRISRVAELLHVVENRATRVVAQLDRDRLVDRVDDEDDKRVRRVLITEKGRELVADLDRRRIRDLETFARRLTPEQRRALERGLRPLLARPDVAELRPVE